MQKLKLFLVLKENLFWSIPVRPFLRKNYIYQALIGLINFAGSDRSIRVLQSMQEIISHGRLANTGYVSILPVDQGIEHTAGASFAPNPAYFDPENIIKLAIEGVQCCCIDPGRSRLCGSKICSQDSICLKI